MNRSLKIYFIALVGIMLSVVVLGQDREMLHGRVLNDAGQAISDVTISIPGAGDPVYTDENGNFALELSAGHDWLLVTPLNDYHEKQVLLQNEDSIIVYLTSLTLDSRYDEISLHGRDKQRRDLITSFSTLDPEGFDEQPYSNVGQYIQGRISGAFITSNSAMPGSGVTMFIRGYSSLLSNNQPLYIVDGIPIENSLLYNEMIEGYNYDPLSTIDPLDISEITVLKDATATAIYGMKGANGVVNIKTLEPTEARTKIDVLLRTGINWKPDNFPQLDANHYRHLANELLFSSGINEEIYKELYPGLYYTEQDKEYIAYKHNTLWQNEIFDNASMWNMRFSISGGGAVANYGLSVSYLNQEGIISNTSLERLNIRLVGSFGIFPWLKLNIASNLTTGTSQLKESALSDVASPILSALFKSPMLNPYKYDSEGNLLATIDEVEELGTSNPTAVRELLSGQAENYRFLTSISLDGDITEEIKFKSVLGLNSNNLKEYLFIPDRGFDLMYDGEVFNVSKAQNSALFSLFNDNQVYYENPLYNSNHMIRASIGFRWQKSTYAEDWGIGKNTASDEYTNLERGFSLLDELGGRNLQWNWGAAYSTINYTYRDKYMVTGSVSADISSRITKQAKDVVLMGDLPVGLFYSIGGAWRLSEESFLSDKYAIEELKLRVSYGIAGNDDVGETNTFSHFVVSQYRETSVLVPGKLANNELTYQNKSQFNIGLDLSLLANRISATLNYFSNKSGNLMLFELQNSYLGYDSYPTNGASLVSTGIEAELFGRIISRKDFSLDFGGNISKISSIVDEISGGEQVLSNFGGMSVINRVGEQANSFYGYRFSGVFSSQAEADAAGLYSDRGMPFGAGDAIFENVPDENGSTDQYINNTDKQILGSFEPDFYGGVFLNTRYKNFSLNIFFQGVYGNEVFNFVRYQNEKMTDLSNQSVKVLQRWQYEGQETTIPKATWNDPVGNNDFSDRWIEDGSYLRLKELTLTYSVKKKLLSINSLKIFVTATNLFTLTAYKGYDPEFSYSAELLYQGVDYGKIPQTKGIMGGIKIGL